MKQVSITLEDLFNTPTAKIYNPDSLKSLHSVSIDTRTLKKGSLYVAIKGEKFDGHDFVSEAVKKGAGAVVINRRTLRKFDKVNIPIITVADTKKTLGDLAQIWRMKLNAKVIALTGSNGKTTTKEIVVSLLSEKYKVVGTKANNNNDIGVPLSIFEADAETEMLVLELGTNHFDEIAYTAEIAQPDLALITNIGESHLEFLKNLEGVLSEKKALLSFTYKRGGEVLINSDDPLLSTLTKEFPGSQTFGFKKKGTVSGKILSTDSVGKTRLLVTFNGRTKEFSLPLYGESNAKNILAAITTVLNYGLNLIDIQKGLKKVTPAKQRADVTTFKKLILIDDTYNANPLSMKAAFDLLGRINKFGRKIAILGDMFELGRQAVKMHKGLAQHILKNKIKEVNLTGNLMKNLYIELKNSGITVNYFKDRAKLTEYVKKNNFMNSTVLVKGSRGMKMEEFATIIKSMQDK
ncbi:MAG: UDP-N-acetylmuramoyl-tripeptide--D-alanyl-D-alanine ligase [Ignavibacteriaceae bacterium]